MSQGGGGGGALSAWLWLHLVKRYPVITPTVHRGCLYPRISGFATISPDVLVFDLIFTKLNQIYLRFSAVTDWYQQV